MSVFEETEQNQLQQILTSYKSRIETYGHTALNSILVKKDDEWRHHVTRIQPQYKNEDAIEYIHHDYGEVLLLQRAFSKEDTFQLLERLTEGNLEIPDAPTVIDRSLAP